MGRGWQDPWVEGIVQKLLLEVALLERERMEYSAMRGGVDSMVGEYSISTVGRARGRPATGDSPRRAD